MADRIFRGDAVRLTDTWTFLISSNTSTHTFILTRNGKSYSVTADGILTAAQLAAALHALLAASTEPEFLEYTWTVDTATITGVLNSPTTRLPATFTKSGTGTSTLTNTIVGQGPNSWIASNFNSGLPANGDTVYLNNSEIDILHSLNQSAVTLASLEIPLDYEGDIGLPRVNEDGTFYLEDRGIYLRISSTVIHIGGGSGNGSSRMQIDTGSVATSVSVYGSGTSDDSNYHPIRLKGSNASNIIRVYAGAVDIAPYPEDSAQYTVIVSGSGRVRCSSRCTITEAEVFENGFLSAFVSVGVTDVTVDGNGRMLFEGNVASASDAVQNLTINRGRVDYRNSGKINNLLINNGGILDLTLCEHPVTITMSSITAGATILDPNGRITFTVPLVLFGCGLEDVTLRLGKSFELQRTF